MCAKILYLGDTAIDQQACYLTGVMMHSGIDFEYVPSDKAFDEAMLTDDVAGMIVSDYPSSNFTASQIEAVCEKVKNGMGFLMIGGWESYVGLDGGYQKTALTNILPVNMADTDDRRNNSFPCMVVKQKQHEILADLPFETNTPLIGGFNEFSAKENSDVLLTVKTYNASWDGQTHTLQPSDTFPLLVAGMCEKGRVACFASDVAPHWVGPLVDWGNERVCAKAKDSEDIEVGSYYCTFFANLVKWVGNL